MKLLLTAILLVRALLQTPSEPFDLFRFFFVSVGGLPLSLLVLLLVQWVKLAFDMQGRALTRISMLIGLGFGIPYQFFIANMTFTPAGIFTAFCYGVGLGLLASGVYDLVEKTALRQVQKVL